MNMVNIVAGHIMYIGSPLLVLVTNDICLFYQRVTLFLLDIDLLVLVWIVL